MSAKENEQNGAFPTVTVKPEPQEAKLAPLSRSSSWQNAGDSKIKPEPMDAVGLSSTRVARDLRDFLESNDRGFLAPNTLAVVSEQARLNLAIKPEPGNVQNAKPTLYTAYSNVADIPYVPEGALKEGLKMVKTIKEEIKKLKLGSKMREDVWARELESLESQGAPTTLIAVCGATGAGKSSILNAVLDDNVVPTSGMRACTAVVTEIAHHAKSTIDADVTFLSEAEWRQELDVLLHDLVDEDGSIKRTTDLKSDAGIAWQKVHAVYPSLLQEQLAKETVDRIIARDPKIASILGTTKKIVAKDSKIFAQEIAKYIDSKDQRRGNKKDKNGTKDKKKDPKKDDKDAGALWPLIRQVNVRCPAAALSTGAVLVDLPGVADANAARNNIAKNYMKKCDCIWILAPITRAVDDKTARDLLGDAFKTQLMNGNYDGSAITFIASKCDDISCGEVIRALGLEDDPKLEDIEARIDQNTSETREWKHKKESAERVMKLVENELTQAGNSLSEYEEGLQALEKGLPFVPQLGSKSKGNESNLTGSKRKGSPGSTQSPRKRRKTIDEDDEDDFTMSEDDSGDSGSERDVDDDRLSEDDDANSESGSQADNYEHETEVELSIDDVKAKIEEYRQVIKASRESRTQLRKDKKEAIDQLATLKKNLTRLQREKNAFCSLKRSEFSRDVLKEDFRMGLKDLDDAAAEERNPEHFDPTVNIRDYDAIDLPVFTCSARDYVRLTHQVKGDGEPTCFSNVKDTGVPDLQKWCHSLTVSSRERAARNFLSHLKTFATTVKTYVQGIGDVTATDRESLQEKWESGPMDDLLWDIDGQDNVDPLEDPFGTLAGHLVDDLYNMDRKPVIKRERRGQRVGVKRRLMKEFTEVVDKSVQDLQDVFREELEEKCRAGAVNASEASVATSDELAASCHWATYRATLRRHGCWKRDLNTELITPFTRTIALSWSKVFEGDLFAALDKAAMASVNALLKDVEESAAQGLRDRCKMQGVACVEEVRVALKKTLDVVRETMTNEQKEASRSLAPHVQEQLREGYDLAMLERGTGSVARQKALFHNYVDDRKDTIFDGGAEVLMGRLTNAADAIGEALDTALELLAEKIEVNLAVLWEGPRNDRQQVIARMEVVDAVSQILDQVKLWSEAERTKSS